ncbi:MAG: ParB/RepB/Spo0J family partition protein [Gammaproteobacteria bacterium]|nr:ParB/RepB/Spo0J family partition protein [Gammaproteobacteria bacterium]
MTNPVLDQERIEYLRARQEASTPTKRVLLPAWPRPEKELPQVDLEVNWVRLSTLNHRTRSEQRRIAHRLNRPDLFSADPNGKEAQDQQYQILADQESFDDLKADLKERNQQQPAVVTAEGVLINGNRRTAALRSLFNDDHHQPSRYITCLVLPEDANRIEMVDLETELQIAREFKEDYTWVNEALLIEEIFEREGKDWKKVASRMHTGIPAVRSRYEKLQQLHQLVDLSRGTRHHADFVDNESAFTELTNHVKGKQADEAASVRAAYFLGTLTGVNYRTLRHLRKPDASRRVRQKLEIDLTLAPLLNQDDQNPKTDILDDVLGPQNDKSSSTLTPILSYVARQGQSEEVELNGKKIATKDLQDSIKQAIDIAAEDARNEDIDQDLAVAPIKHLESAINSVVKAAEALEKARVFQDWDEAEYTSRLSKLKETLPRLDL